MALGTGNTVRIQVVFVIGGGITCYCREVLPEVQAVFAIGFALVVLGG